MPTRAYVRVDLTSINQEEFFLNEAELLDIGPARLIVPRKNKFKWAEEERDLRSLLCRPDGTVISAGFPKFGNWGEFQWNDRHLTQALKDNLPVRYYKKLDGTLVIRSVIDGHVHFRTRGRHDLGDFKDRVMKLVEDYHWDLLDPELHPYGSLLFEYTGPDNHIVVRYGESHLFALAHVDFTGGRLAVRPFPRRLATAFDVDLAPMVHIGDSFDEVKTAAARLEGEEGFVAWAPGREGGEGYHLVKLKSAWYFRLHALRSEATPRYVREYCFRNNVWGVEAVQEKLAQEGFDWELVSYLKPMIEEAATRQEEALALFCAVHTRAAPLREEADRKTVALTCKDIAKELGDEGLFHYAIMIATGKDEEAKDYLHARSLDMGVVAFRAWKKSEGII